MEDNQITIKVIGPHYSGKSTIAELIIETLQKHNFKATTIRDDDIHIVREPSVKKQRLESVASRTHATVETVQLVRGKS